jgi:hypothetical protein
MPGPTRNAGVPASLRPKGRPDASAPQRVPQVPVPTGTDAPGPAAGPRQSLDPLPPDDPRTLIHVAIVVPHPKLAEVIRDRVVAIGPVGTNIAVQVHVVLDDKKHAATRLDPLVRMALVDLGVDPADVAFTFPSQVELGWAPTETIE